MRVFKDLDLVEHLGSGMSRILDAYNESIFEFTPNFLIVTFPFAEGFLESNINNGTNFGTNGTNHGTNENHIKILNLLKINSKATLDIISEQTNLSRRTVGREIKILQELGRIKRIGSTRGHWEVL
ncbi:MAG: HTH domain-containing protein [Firmicutes bacterium]|nr:HTH domain-containing protein [Bacillota bacterium]